MMGMKVMIKSGEINSADVNMFLKAGSAIDDRNKKWPWMEQKTWLNLLALSRHKFEGEHQPFFGAIIERITRDEKGWRSFFEKPEPENEMVPDFNDKIVTSPIGHFLHICLIRCVREDRTVLASRNFIKTVFKSEDYVVPCNDKIDELYEESAPNRPVLYLL